VNVWAGAPPAGRRKGWGLYSQFPIPNPLFPGLDYANLLALKNLGIWESGIGNWELG